MTSTRTLQVREHAAAPAAFVSIAAARSEKERYRAHGRALMFPIRDPAPAIYP
jgi:hypothetical protein